MLTEYQGEECGILIALHSVKSAPSVARYAEQHPHRSIVVAITGTDIYPDNPVLAQPIARRTAAMATRIVFLRNPSNEELDWLVAPDEQAKVRVIYQSAEPPAVRRDPCIDRFEVCVLGHLRPVKDPFRTAEAARLLPPQSQIQVLQVGAALTPVMDTNARREESENPRYCWLGELPRPAALTLLSGCRLLVVTSISEGGPSAVSEALACDVPVIASRISGVVGLLGVDYPGYFPVGNTRDLAQLLWRCEMDSGFLNDLQTRCVSLRPLLTPDVETRNWRRLLAELA